MKIEYTGLKVTFVNGQMVMRGPLMNCMGKEYTKNDHGDWVDSDPSNPILLISLTSNAALIGTKNGEQEYFQPGVNYSGILVDIEGGTTLKLTRGNKVSRHKVGDALPFVPDM